MRTKELSNKTFPEDYSFWRFFAVRRKKPKHMDTRIVRRFAILPISTPDEWRWLEWVTIKQEYNAIWDDCTNGDVWCNAEFIDKKSEYIK